jgi:hypothetical protein
MIDRAMILPPFTSGGVVPATDYALTIDELGTSSLVAGSASRTEWDMSWRRQLVDNLRIMLGHLWQVGITDIFVDGSFAEDKAHPNDIDGYFLCEPNQYLSGELESKLQTLDPIWTWDPDSRYAARAGGKRQLPMWHKYRVELFPHIGQLTGIVDAFGNELEFPSAFRLTRDGTPKGIIKIVGGPT